MASQSDRRSTERRQSPRHAGGALDFGAELIGYRIEASDGPIGRVTDFCVEEEGWAVTGLLADPRGILRTSRRIFVPLSAIESIDQAARKIYAGPTRDELARGSRKQPRPRNR